MKKYTDARKSVEIILVQYKHTLCNTQSVCEELNGQINEKERIGTELKRKEKMLLTNVLTHSI